MAEERDRWADHWRMADLDQEVEHLLDLLQPAEELRAAVPGVREPRAAAPARDVLVGITDRRVLVVGRRREPRADSGPGLGTGMHVDDVTPWVTGGGRGRRIEVAGGHSIRLDLADDALDRLWAATDGLGCAVGVR